MFWTTTWTQLLHFLHYFESDCYTVLTLDNEFLYILPKYTIQNYVMSMRINFCYIESCLFQLKRVCPTTLFDPIWSSGHLSMNYHFQAQNLRLFILPLGPCTLELLHQPAPPSQSNSDHVLLDFPHAQFLARLKTHLFQKYYIHDAVQSARQF